MQQTSSVPPVRSIHLITLYKHDDEPRVMNHLQSRYKYKYKYKHDDEPHRLWISQNTNTNSNSYCTSFPALGRSIVYAFVENWNARKEMESRLIAIISRQSLLNKDVPNIAQIVSQNWNPAIKGGTLKCFTDWFFCVGTIFGSLPPPEHQILPRNKVNANYGQKQGWAPKNDL